MTIRPADRILLILILEVAVLVGFVSFAESAFGAWVSPGWVAALMLGSWIVAPVLTVLPVFASKPERLTRGIGVVVVLCGAGSTLIRSHESADLTLILLGLGLIVYGVRRAPDTGTGTEVSARRAT